MTVLAFEADWEKQWLAERGVEIIFGASRQLSDDFKLRHPENPWRKVAGICNVLRHNYENISPQAMIDARLGSGLLFTSTGSQQIRRHVQTPLRHARPPSSHDAAPSQQ